MHVPLCVLQQGRMPGIGVWAIAYGLLEQHSVLGACNLSLLISQRGIRRYEKGQDDKDTRIYSRGFLS